jgi:hypothetical protein
MKNSAPPISGLTETERTISGKTDFVPRVSGTTESSSDPETYLNPYRAVNPVE